MKDQINFKLIIPLILLVLILVGGLFYYQQNKESQQTVAGQSEGIVLGETGEVGGNTAITDGEIYNNKISEIRKPINQGFEDLAEKAKYTTLFDSGEIQSIIDDTRNKIAEGIKTLEHLNIETKFQEANDKHLQSFNLLLEAINAFDKSRSEKDQKEAQRLRELYAYNIEQSNKILQQIQIPR